VDQAGGRWERTGCGEDVGGKGHLGEGTADNLDILEPCRLRPSKIRAPDPDASQALESLEELVLGGRLGNKFAVDWLDNVDKLPHGLAVVGLESLLEADVVRLRELRVVHLKNACDRAMLLSASRACACACAHVVDKCLRAGFECRSGKSQGTHP